MKFIRLVSDVHLDFDIRRAQQLTKKATFQEAMESCWLPPLMPGDEDTCLVIAGDIWYERRFLTKFYADGESWLAKVAKRFKYVIFVLGNHDYWDTNVLYEPTKIKEELKAQGITNAFLLEKDAITLENVKFVGGTLWTDFKRGDPLVMGTAPSMMNDYRFMRYGAAYGKCHPNHLYEIFMNTKKFIFENVKREGDQYVFVVTHMAPSWNSIAPHFRAEIMSNYLYFSDLEKRIAADGKDIDFWAHGHIHWPADYLLGKTRVLCNPRGYAMEAMPDFNPNFRIEL